MRHRDVNAAVALLCLLSGTACEWTVSLSGLTGGQVVATDASVDAPLGDGSTTTDGSPDAFHEAGPGAPDSASPGDAARPDSGDASAATGFCDSFIPPLTFCDDFDHAAMAVVWDVITTENGTIGLDSKYYVSAPNAALFSIGAVGSSGTVDVSLKKSFNELAGVPLEGTLSLDIKFDEVDEGSTPASSILCAIDLVSPAGNLYEVQVLAAYDGSSGMNPTIAEMAIDSSGNTSGYNEKSSGEIIPLTTWATLKLVYHLPAPDAGPGDSVDFYVGTTLAATIDVPDNIVSGTPRIVIGTGFVSTGSGPWKFHVDNVFWNAIQEP